MSSMSIDGMHISKDAWGLPTISRISTPVKRVAKIVLVGVGAKGLEKGIETVVNAAVTQPTARAVEHAVNNAVGQNATTTFASTIGQFGSSTLNTLANGRDFVVESASNLSTTAKNTWWWLSWLPDIVLVAGGIYAGVTAYNWWRGSGSYGANQNVQVHIHMPQNGGACPPGHALTPDIKKEQKKVDVAFACKAPQEAPTSTGVQNKIRQLAQVSRKISQLEEVINEHEALLTKKQKMRAAKIRTDYMHYIDPEIRAYKSVIDKLPLKIDALLNEIQKKISITKSFVARIQ